MYGQEEFIEYGKLVWNDRVRFAHEVIGFKQLDPMQEAFLKEMDREDHIAIKAGHGTSKTTDLAISTLHYLSTRPGVRILCTAPSKHQLNDILWAEMSKQIGMMREHPIGKMFANNLEWKKETVSNLCSPNEWYAAARTATKENTDSLQGFHEKYVLRVIEEASGVSDAACEVVEAATGTIETKTIFAGNPTKRTGQFYRCFNQDIQFYKTFTRSCLNVTHPLLRKEALRYAERMAKKYGVESNFYRIRVLGEFPLADEDTYIPIYWAEAARDRQIWPQNSYDLVYGVDVARSLNRDRTVIAKRRGDQFLPYHVVRYNDTMKIVRDVAQMADREKPKAIFIDVIGVGGGVFDRLKQLGYPVIAVNSAETISMEFPEKYVRLRDELWGKMRDWLEAGRGKLWDNEDNDLIGELSTPKAWLQGAKTKIESKDEMRERLKKTGGDESNGSPDIADAHIMTFAMPIADYNRDTQDDGDEDSNQDDGPLDPVAGY